MTNSTKSLREGGRVVICGLHGNLAASLNGSTGLLKRFDNSCGRWEVDTATAGFKKVKPVNLLPLNDQQMPGEDNIAVVPHPLTIRRRSKLCRFGLTCWRPDCHFVHGNEEQRCDAWARLWAQEPISASSASEIAVSLKDSLSHDIAKLKADSFKHEAQLTSSVRDLEELKDTFAATGRGLCGPDATTSAGARLLNVNEQFADLDRRISDLDQQLSADLDTRMLGAIHAAVVPLAEKVSEKVILLERRVELLTDDPDDATSKSIFDPKSRNEIIFLRLCLLAFVAAMVGLYTISLLLILALCIECASGWRITVAKVFRLLRIVVDALPCRRPFHDS